MDLRLSPLMIVIGRFEIDMHNSMGPRHGAPYRVAVCGARIDTPSFLNFSTNIFF